MPKSSFIDFKAVKEATRMERVLEHYGLRDQFKQSGDSLSGPCQIHKGSNPTQFRVSVSKNIWNCFSECKQGGNVLDFIARMEDVSIHAAALKAIDWFGLGPETMSGQSSGENPPSNEASEKKLHGRPKPASKPGPVPSDKVVPNKPLKFRLDKLDRNHAYLAERGLKPETVIDFDAGFCAKGMMADRIAIPIHNQEGELVAYSGRWPGEPAEGTPKYKMPQGFRKSLELFNLHRAKQEPADKSLVIVEGFFDCMKLYQNGCRKVVALMGSSMSPAQEELIRKHSDRNTRAIVMLDEDEAGRGGREDIAFRLAKFVFVKVHTFGKEGQQPEHLSAEELSAIIA